MTFRQDCLTYCETQVIFCALLLLFIIAALVANMPFLLWGAVLFLLSLLIHRKLEKNYITIDETGVVCCRKSEKLWGYQWEEIDELRTSSYLRHKAVIVIAKVDNNPRVPQQAMHHFQLGKDARKAIERYAPSSKAKNFL